MVSPTEAKVAVAMAAKKKAEAEAAKRAVKPAAAINNSGKREWVTAAAVTAAVAATLGVAVMFQ